MNIDVSTALATLQLDPGNPQALKALADLQPSADVDAAALQLALGDARRLHRERGDYELVLQLMEVELAWTWMKDAARRADLLHEKGRLLSDDLLRGDAGLAAVQQALEALPSHGPSKESAAQMSLMRGNWRPISKRYLQQAQEAEAAGKDAAHAASLFVSVAELLLKYGGDEAASHVDAEAHLRKSRALDPANRRSGVHVERLLRDKSRWDELITLYAQRAEAATAREDRALAEVMAGEVSTKIGKGDEALAHFRKALEASPNESRALRPVRAALTKQGQKGDAQAWAELAKVLEAAVRTKRGEQDVLLQVDLATLMWKQLGDEEGAEGFFRRVRKIEPANHAMVDFYRAYYGAQGKKDPARLLHVLAQAQKTETDVDRRVAMGMEMARAAEGRPQSADKAIELWKGLLRLKPRLPEAIASLKTLYTRTEKWNALLEILKEELDALPADKVDDKVARYLDIVAIYRDRLNLDVMVVNTYLSVLALRPDHPDALAALSQRYESQGRWSDLIGVLGKQADAERDGAARVALHRRIATLWADKLGKHQNAVASLEKILEADPADVETSARLKDLYAKSRAWRPLLDVYRRELPHLQNGAAKRPRLSEMARIAGERLNDVREAINLWNQVLAIEPRDADALAGLATLYERERRWPALVEILERQRQNVEGQAAAELVLLERRGMLLYEKLGATEGAIDVFRRIQALQPQNARAQRALREIYAQSGDFAALEAMYVEQGAFSDLCDQLTSLADRTADMAARTRLLERVASLSVEKLNQPERALKAYERILTTDPQNRRAALALVPLYRQAQKWPRLLATYEALLGPAAAQEGASLAERLELLAEARLICEQRLGSKGLAFQWAARAFEAAPKNEPVRTDLERVAGEADEHAPLAALYAKRADATTDAEERLWLLRRALRLNLTKLYKPVEARAFAERIVAELGHDDEADAALEQIFTQTKAWPEVAKLLHGRADRAPDIGERVKLLFRIAQLEEERVGDAAAAAQTLGAIVEADPTNDRALKALARVAEARQDWAGLVEALRADLEVRGGKSNVGAREELLLRIGQIQETRLADADATFASYREVLQSNPQSAAAVAGLERLLAAGKPAATAEVRAEIATLALPLYERVDNAAKLAGAHEALLAVADTRGEKVERLEKLRALYAGPLGDAASAYRASLALFELDPSDAANRGQLVAFADAAGTTAGLVDKARALAQTTDDAILRRDLLVTVAELQEQRLGRSDDAEKAYVEILSVEPLNVGAFNALARLYRAGQRWADLRSLLDLRQTATLDPKERLDLLASVAELDEVALEDAAHAIATYEKMLELDTADMRAHRALDRHYAAAERWRDLEELLGTRRSFANAGEIAELEFRRADLRATRLGDVDGALDLLEEIVRTAPSHEGARRLLEKLLTSAEHRQRVARVLEPLYEASGAWARLVSVLEVRREVVGAAGPEAAALLARIADIQENKLQARAPALATWRQVLAADPANPDALTEIERVATTLERFSELVEVYQEQAFKLEASDLSGRAELLSRAAKLFAGRLGNRRAGIEAWKLVLGLDPENAETGRPAATALEALYVETGDVAALVKILRTQAGWADGADERKALLFRIAGLEEKSLGDADAAVATLRSILDIDPQDQTAIAGLEQIFEAGSQHAQRVEMLRKRIDLARDPAARQELWRRVAGLLEKDVGDVEEAIAACVAILDENPEDASALETLSRLYEQQGRHRDRLEILERRLVLAPPAGRADLLRQIAALLEGPLGDPAAALDRWREVLAAAPADALALAALERFLQPAIDASLRLTAAQALEPVYEKAGRFAELASVVQVYVDNETDGHERLSQLTRLAGLQETRLGNAEGAFATTALAIRDALAEPELPALLDTYERLAGGARGGDVAALYRDISPDVLDEGVKLRLERFIADAARAHGDVAGAADYYRRVLDRLPEDEDALAALDRIYRETNDVESLSEILARRADIARDVRTDAGAEQRYRLQLGQLAEKPLGRREDAIAAYERVLELAPEDRDAREALDRLYTETERWTDLTRFLEGTLERGRLAERDVVGIRFRLAQIEHDRQLDRESALAHLRVVLQGDPDHAGAIAMLEGMLDDVAVQGSAAELLEPVYAGRGDWPQLIKIGEIRLLQVEDPAERVAWTKRIARLYEEQLEDFDSALKWYGKVFQEAPTERQSAEPLLRLADKLGRWQDVGALFAGYVADELGDDPAVLEVVRRTAEIFDHRLNDHEEARKHYRRLFETLPEDRAVAQLYEGALERWEAWQDLRELVDEQAGRTIDAIAKLTLLRRSAKLDEERLANRSRAIGTLQEALEIDPTNEAATAALDAELERLLRAEELWHDLGDHLAVVLSRMTDPAAREAVTLRLADVLETKIGDVSAAVDRYAEVLERSPGRREAITALERIAADPDHRHRVAVVLEPVYRAAGDWGKLVGALEAQLETVDDHDQRVTILREMADIYQRIGRLDLAFDSRSRAWLVDVSSAATLGEMEALAVSARQYGPLVATLQKGAVEAVDPDLQAQLWGISARLAEENLSDVPQAIEAWRAALAARPDDIDAFLALERLLSQAARPAELVEVLERHADVTLDASEKKTIAKRIAVLYEDALKQREPALRAWEAVLDIDANDVEALDALAQLHLAGSSYRELAEILERKLQLVEIPGHRRALRLEVARLYDEQLQEADQAVSQLRAVLDETGSADGDALAALDAIFTRDERHVDLLEVLDARAAGETSAPARDALALRAARLTEVELSDVEGGVARYQKILATSPGDVGAKDALWTIARGTDYRASAVAALEPVLRSARDWEGVVELYELRLAIEDGAPERMAALAEIARIEEIERRDTHRAFEAWARALTEEASASAPREALERLAATTGDWAGLARVYAERMDATFDAALQRSLALRLAQLFEERLGDSSRAADYLRQALSLPGDEAAVLASLERVLRAQDAHAELAEILSREAEVAVDPAAQAEFLAALGEVRLRALDDADGALTAFRDALERNPDHAGARGALHELLDRAETREGALEILEPLAEARGDETGNEELLALYEYRVGLRDDAAERAHWLRKIAEICDTRLGDAARALDALGRALKEEPMPGAALDDLERVAGAAGLAHAGGERIEAVLDAAETDAARELALRAARLYEAAPADLAGAERLYQRVLAADAENIDALTALEALYRGAGAPAVAHLASILERRAALELDPQARKRRLGEAAVLHEERGDVTSAIAAWQTLRAAEEGDADALGELARLYEATGQAEALVDALAERARFAEDPSERATLWARVGGLRLQQNDVDGAAQAYREALEGAPEDHTVLGALETVEERREDWATLQEVLQRRLNAVSGPAQLAVLLKLAKNAETRLSDLEQASGYLRQVLDADPTSVSAYVELERLLRAGERWYDLVDVLGKHADLEGSAGRKPTELALRVAIADVWERELSSPESAVEALEKVLEVAPANVAALLSMARIHEAAERWDEASAALERAATTATSGPEAAEIHFRNAQILRAKESSPEEIDALLLRALDASPTHLPTLEALEAGSRDANDDEKLVQLLELRLEATPVEAKSEATLRKLLGDLAALYKKLGRGAQAVPVLERLVAMSPGEISGREELADALIAAGRTGEAVAIARDLIEQLGKARRGKEAARWYQRLGAIAIADGDLVAASEHFNAAYKLDPAHPLTLSALGRLSFERGDVETARKFYRSLLLQSFDEATTGVSKAEVYLMLGRMHVSAKEIPKARNMFERGLETDPKNELLKQALEQLPRN